MPIASVVNALGYAAVSAFILWRVIVRFRRAVGRQRFSRFRAPITLGVYGLIAWALIRLLWGHAALAVELFVSVVAGAALGHVAIKRTKFEPTSQGLFYTPYSPIALSLAVLFAVRLGYRVLEVTWLGSTHAGGVQGFVLSPLTLASLGLLIGYNVYYTVRLAQWRRRVLQAKNKREHEGRTR